MKFSIKTTLKWLLRIAIVIVLYFALKAAGLPAMRLALIMFVVLAVCLCFMSFIRFRKGSKTVGALCAVGALFFLIATVKVAQINTMMSMPRTMPPTTVSSAVVEEKDWAPILYSVGSVSAVQGAVVSTELGGVVSEVKFQSGAVAKKGDVLLRLDTSAEEGQLHAAEAELALAEANVARTRDLVARKVVSKADSDAAESALAQKKGSVENMRSMMAKKEVRAPFDGQLGIRQVNVGQSIEARQPVVALTALDTLYVDFAVPQQELSKLASGYEIRVTTDAVPGREFKGKLTAINSMIDTVTRNVTVQATLPNPDHALTPGMFTKVEIQLPEKHKALVIPGSAISYASYGDSVYVIETSKDPKTGKESRSIRQQIVRLGQARGDLVEVTDGLKPGETVVSTGVFKLRNNMPVTINNELAPKPQENPTPVDS